MTTAQLIWRIGALLLITFSAGAAHTQEASSNAVYIQDKLAEAREAYEGEPFELTVVSDQANFGDVAAELYAETVDAPSTVATAAAIANSLSVASPSTLQLVAPQINEMGAIEASMTLESTHSTDLFEGTSAAIANSLSASAGDFSEIRMMQTNLGDSVSASQNSVSGWGSAEARLTAAAIANSGSLEINGALDLESFQTNESIVESEMIVALARAGEFTTVTSAAMGNSLSAVVTAGNMVGESIQTHDAASISAGVEFASRHGSHGPADISLTAAAIANSATVATSIDVDPELSFVLKQSSTGDVNSWLKSDGPRMASPNTFLSGTPGEARGVITATAAAIANSATIEVASPVKVK